MKAFIMVMLLGLATLTASAQLQQYVLTTGTNGYVTIAVKAPKSTGVPIDYNRSNLGVSFSINGSDTLMAIYSNNGTYPALSIPYTYDTLFRNGDAASGKFPTADSLYRWTRRHIQYVGN